MATTCGFQLQHQWFLILKKGHQHENSLTIALSPSLTNIHYVDYKCCNPNLGFTTKAKACKGVGQKWSMGVTSHVPGNVGECERMNPHTVKWAPTLGIRVPMESRIFKEWLQRPKPIGLKSFLYHWKKLLECICLKWVRMFHLDTLNTSYGQKKGWKSNWQFDFRPLKVGIWPNFLAWRWRATYR